MLQTNPDFASCFLNSYTFLNVMCRYVAARQSNLVIDWLLGATDLDRRNLLMFIHSFQCKFCLVCFPHVVQKQTLGEVGIELSFNSQFCWKYVCHKLLQFDNHAMLQVTTNIMLGMSFHVFYIFQCIFRLFLSWGSAEADNGWGEKLNSHLMESCVWNICTKNYENLVIFVQVRIENVWDVFFDTQYILECMTHAYLSSHWSLLLMWSWLTCDTKILSFLCFILFIRWSYLWYHSGCNKVLLNFSKLCVEKSQNHRIGTVVSLALISSLVSFACYVVLILGNIFV